MSDFKNKVILVTGSSGGIGSQICKQFAAKGAIIAIHYSKNLESAKKIKNEITTQSPMSEIFQADITKSYERKKLIEEVVNKFGKIDILINNAGVMKNMAFEDATEQDLQYHINMNFIAPIMLIQTALNYMPQGASIINISTSLVKVPRPMATIYSSSKAAFEHFSLAMLKEDIIKKKKIRINVVCPGPCDTNLTKAMPEERRKIIQEKTLVEPRLGKPEEIVSTILFVASNDAKWVDGQVIIVDGGLSSNIS